MPVWFAKLSIGHWTALPRPEHFKKSQQQRPSQGTLEYSLP